MRHDWPYALALCGMMLSLTLHSANCAGEKGTQTSEGGEELGLYADRVLNYSPVTGGTGGIFNEQNVLGAPGSGSGVTSLGYDLSALAAEGGQITLGWGDGQARHCITNGSGADFIVYENPFALTDSYGDGYFTEAAFVELSANNISFYRFTPTYPAADEALVGKPVSYQGLAGITPGGDAFDLEGLMMDHGLPADFQGCYLRIVDGGTQVPDYDSHGEMGMASQDGSGADLNAVEALNSRPVSGLSP